MRIREEMEKVDKNDLRAIREKKKGLAKFWNISFSRVASIYYEERDKFSKEYEELDKICDQIYEEEFAVFEKKMRDLLGKKTEHRKGVVLGPTGEDEE